MPKAMLVENLIEMLEKCKSLSKSLKGSYENTQVLLPDGDDRVQLVNFVVYSHRDQAVTFYPDKPNWDEESLQEGIEITVLSETDDFAEITWREL